MTPLSADEDEELRADLERLAAMLQATLDGSADAARPIELDQPAIGRVSRIDAIQQQKMLEATRAGQRSRLQQVRAALKRSADDEYGECQGCGEAVGYARLKARPESAFCIECQSLRERT
jgi:DnaK suppressor protein